MDDVSPLTSFVAGEWVQPTGEGAQVVDATTRELVARVDSTGIDTAAMVTHAREVGGPNLRDMTFAKRAGLLKELAGRLSEVRDELLELSTRSGATAADGKVDVDGGSGTLYVLAGAAAKAFPDAHHLLDGEAVPLSRSGSFGAQHVLTPRRGVAVQVNAFNFPVWGVLEKFAPAFLAGVPTIVKPATQTAHISHRLVEFIIATGLLPEGCLQLLGGDARPLLDHLEGQDSLLFTGSAGVAAKLRAHPAVVENAVRFNGEADSLNAAILGPDAEPGTDEFDLFVAEVVREITTKAGQRCTCIRRALVPSDRRDAVVEALRARLSNVTVGNPASPESAMGALVSVSQRDDVRAAVRALLDGGAELAIGDLDEFEVVDGDAEVGAFLPPLVLTADADVDVVHQVEAFGPVTTVVGYDDLGHAGELARRGRGSLVASVFSTDRDTVRELLGEIGAHHGRLLVVDASVGEEQTGHGTPMPQTVHGGPGRAGGGEELGGLRSVHHFLQRTAVQGATDLLDGRAPSDTG